MIQWIAARLHNAHPFLKYLLISTEYSLNDLGANKYLSREYESSLFSVLKIKKKKTDKAASPSMKS